ncbi:hypothetical protein CONPUDRAFT_82579 [Coniophora puteana RWD-64-598 SS2]|uniref:GST C-terminal domain-containing protein n=1 Tax=Coniophora puteana (strain RWD-64-598) TaxID=741705 RepID=A0A5M3MMK2_CONPW|nr:uncharacterized protein CONPUDRAFT_82579 [Coniophora puteana RWD-64-598 SS2]EIW80266.1 hypothetical protein CONPUDRAFT_82579 [Coniophora puteana RWD-64-598 SS2]
MASKNADHRIVPTDKDGSFKRPDSAFRNWIEKGGKFEPKKGRYHLYVAYSCPWATRTLIVRKLKGLEDFISVDVVSPGITPEGWVFANVHDFPGATRDSIHGDEVTHLRQLYFKADPNYAGRYTVPTLWDKELETIVSNESADIIRMLNTAFNDQLPADKAAIDIYPEVYRNEIDEINSWVYDTVNNGVYRSGFATTQKAYEDAVVPLFKSLDRLEKILEGKDYLVGDRLTEADIRLWVTIIRFDPVYFSHFKCNIRDIRHDYPNLNRWLKNLYWNNSAFKESTFPEHIKAGYYSGVKINPTGIVPVGPNPFIEPL